VRQERAIPEATVFGHGFKSSSAQAAFANGTSAHALDFDHSTYLGQPTSALIPALISLGESLGVSGPELLQAYVAGFEVTTKIAKSITEEGRGELRIPTQIGTHSAGKSTLVPIQIGTCSDANRHPCLG
jgi:2-methylcitrate dehydratase PrpD